MIGMITLGVAAVLIICAAEGLAPKLKVAAPLMLVGVGLVASLVPGVPSVEVEPEVILEVILPPLLYTSAVRMPAMSFRREFSAISGLSVALVVVSSLILGGLFAVLVPDLGFVWGAALGAILSPTDAVATSIIKGRGGVPGRVVTILDGESLLNDATALVILRTAIVAAASAFSFWGALGSFAYSVVIAVIIGTIVGVGNFWVRRKVTSASASTVLSFTLPFLASVPAELLGSSGLVAAVVAGLITGFRGPRELAPQHRISSEQNWASIQVVLEGLVFLLMGMQVRGVLTELETESIGAPAAAGLAVLALLVALLVRGGFVAPLLWSLRKKTARGQAMQGHVTELHEAIARDGIAALDDTELTRYRGDPDRPDRRSKAAERAARRRAEMLRDPARAERFATRLRRVLADIGYRTGQPLGPREGAILVWGGMRGAVTVAAAQTLPAEAPHRPLLVFVAFVVATLSLLVQGGTIGMVVRWLFPPGAGAAQAARLAEQREAVTALLEAAADDAGEAAQDPATGGPPRDDPVGEPADVPEPTSEDPTSEESGSPGTETSANAAPRKLTSGTGARHEEYARRLRIVGTQREALLDARDDGLFDPEVLATALANLDAKQIMLEMNDSPS